MIGKSSRLVRVDAQHHHVVERRTGCLDDRLHVLQGAGRLGGDVTGGTGTRSSSGRRGPGRTPARTGPCGSPARRCGRGRGAASVETRIFAGHAASLVALLDASTNSGSRSRRLDEGLPGACCGPPTLGGGRRRSAPLRPGHPGVDGARGRPHPQRGDRLRLGAGAGGAARPARQDHHGPRAVAAAARRRCLGDLGRHALAGRGGHRRRRLDRADRQRGHGPGRGAAAGRAARRR